MATREERISQSLRAILTELPVGGHIPESDQYREVLVGLEHYISQFFPEELDGIIALVSQKAGDMEVAIFGLAILINDQTVTPLDLRIQLSPFADTVSWFECRLGERGPQGMVRTPYESLHKASKRLRKLGCRAEAIEWMYEVTSGQWRPEK